MSTEDTASGTQKLVGGGLLVAVALGIGQVLAYAQTLVAARTLTPAQFGAFSALLALLLIGNTVALATQAVAARHIVATDLADRADETAAAWRTTLQAAALTAAFWLIISPLIGFALRLDSPLTYILLALTFFPLTVMGGALGIAQGQELHARLSAVYLAVGVPKTVVTIALLLTLATLTAGMLDNDTGAGWAGVYLRHVNYLPPDSGMWPKTDLDADRDADVVVREGTTVRAWIMEAERIVSDVLLVETVPLAWVLVDVADLDGDHDGDLIWRNTATGDVAVHIIQDAQVEYATTIAPHVALSWTLKCACDFNGDGRADLLWANPQSGQLALWFMDGTAIADGAYLPTLEHPQNWEIAGVQDFDGDHMADIVWRNTVTNAHYYWKMAGAGVEQAGLLLDDIGPGWRVAACGDLNADGRSDLFWRNVDDGRLAFWVMGGLLVELPDYGPFVVLDNWKVVGAADNDGDCISEILWQNIVTGAIASWHVEDVDLENVKILECSGLGCDLWTDR